MRNSYTTAILLLVTFFASGQIINFPDAAFKDKLLEASPTSTIAKDSNGNNITIDTNGDNEIEVAEALLVYELDVYIGFIADLGGIENFTNLTHLNCGLNNLTSLDVSALTNLQVLECVNNDIATLNVNGLSNLETLQCAGNELTTLDVSSLTALVDLWCAANMLTSLNLDMLTNLETLDCSFNQLTSLTLNLPNLIEADCSDNLLTSLNVNGSPAIENLLCTDNALETLAISNLSQLSVLEAQNNNLESIELLDLPALETLFLFNNALTSVDLSTLTNLNFVGLNSNQLETLFVKNGVVEEVLIGFNPTLEYICGDDAQLTELQETLDFLGYEDTSLNSYCSFVPGGEYYEVAGTTTYDFDGNGCEVLEDITVPFLEFTVTDGTNTGVFIANSSGEYTIPLQEGTHTITPSVENPTYYTLSPASFTVDFPTDPSPFVQDICMTANGTHPDLDVTILPLEPARPGFDATYRISYTNKGNQVQSGDVTLTYMDALMTYVSSDPVFDSEITSSYTWDFTNLQPFETRTIEIVFTINSPMDTPPVNIDDILVFSAIVNPVGGDETPLDNEFVLDQTVVGSFDPNDITCLQGETLSEAAVGDDVHYLIRFENTGTFPAENIVVVNEINPDYFEIASIRPLNSSHEYVTRITGNKVEFIFEDINLPFNNADNDGFVLFKIKTVPDLEIGDSFSNEAAIYFDFNFPIITNTYTTTIEAPLGIAEQSVDGMFSMYPNPSEDIFYIQNNGITKVAAVTLLNMLGQEIMKISEEVSQVAISSLQSGAYFVKIESEQGAETFKLLKK
jgi:Secretion system C-terminal sorting domain